MPLEFRKVCKARQIIQKSNIHRVLEDHLIHLELVFSRLRENQLYKEGEKCVCSYSSYVFWGIEHKRNVCMDGWKVEGHPPPAFKKRCTFRRLA